MATGRETLSTPRHANRTTLGGIFMTDPGADDRAPARHAKQAACGATAPDRSGRTCDKPTGHVGDHWSYDLETVAWAAALDAAPSSPTLDINALIALMMNLRRVRDEWQADPTVSDDQTIAADVWAKEIEQILKPFEREELPGAAGTVQPSAPTETP